MNDTQAKALIEEMEAIKKLLILQLVGSGTKQKEIAQMLKISEATMSRMIPKGITKPGVKSGS